MKEYKKTSFRIIYKDEYQSYDNALKISNLPSLSERRNQLMLKFALKCINNKRTESMFPRNKSKTTRHTEEFKVPFARTTRYKHSAIPSMSRLLNENENRKGK